MRTVLRIFGILCYLFSMAAIVFAIGLYSVNTFAFGGRSAEIMALEPVYYYYEPLVDDYISSLRDGKPARALSVVEPNLLRYYCEFYRLNTDIIKTLDDAYTEGIYDDISGWYIHHTIEWNPGVYSDTLDKLDAEADRGIDLYVRMEKNDADEPLTYIFEVIHRESYWYLLSVTPSED